MTQATDPADLAAMARLFARLGDRGAAAEAAAAAARYGAPAAR
jgi:hypothetical protein